MSNKSPNNPYEEYLINWYIAYGNKKTGKLRKAMFFIGYCLLIIMCSVFILFNYGIETRNNLILKEGADIKYISSFDDLKKQFEGKLVLNKNYKLETDITLTEEITIGSEEYPFTGTFDGQKHTITYNYKAAKSLFGYTSEKAVIYDLKVCGSLELEDGNIGAAIVAVNHGTISNCKVGINKEGKVENFTLSIQNYATAGGIAAYNYGVIDNCTALMQVTKNGTDGVMKTCFGGICAKNSNDVLKNSIGEVKGEAKCDITFTRFKETDVFNNYEEFNGGNFFIGAVIGQNEGERPKGVLYVANRGAYLSDREIVKFISVDEFKNLLN